MDLASEKKGKTEKEKMKERKEKIKRMIMRDITRAEIKVKEKK